MPDDRIHHEIIPESLARHTQIRAHDLSALKNIQGRAGDVVIRYEKNAELYSWMMRLANAALLFLFLGIVWVSACRGSGAGSWMHSLLHTFAHPFKMFLDAKPTADLARWMFVLTPFTMIANVIGGSAICYLVYRSSVSKSFLYLTADKLLVVRLVPNGKNGAQIGRGDLTIAGRYYYNLKEIELSERTDIVVERPGGTKSSLDYLLCFSNPGGETLKVRWGDLMLLRERDWFWQQLAAKYPRKIAESMFEPFKPLAARQSYTEIWLNELSGAPQREKMTPLIAGNDLQKGDYKIIGKAGVGGQGIVYFATTAKYPGQQVVLKEFVLPVYPDIRVRKKAAERFQAEASMLSRLNHPQIAKFFEMFVEDHRAYVVLELVEGTTLKEMVAAQGRLPERQVIDLAKQIAKVVLYLHAQTPPVVHRDLSPDNIMLDPEGVAKLIDFSVAQELSSNVTGSVVGKPNYISPEQFRGKATPQTDIYSFGATLFYLLTAHDPTPISVADPQRGSIDVSDALSSIVFSVHANRS